MKRFFPLAFLICVAFSCSDNEAIRLRYELEKLFFDADRLVQQAQIQPGQSDQARADQIRQAYGELTARSFEAVQKVAGTPDSITYREISILTYRSAIRYSQVLFATRRFDSTAGVLNRLLNLVQLPPTEQANATVLLAQCFQSLGRISEAVMVFSRAVDMLNPPLGPDSGIVFSVFNVPDHLVQIYRQLDDSVRENTAQTRALAYYGQLARRFDTDPLGTAAYAMLARMHSETGQWYEAIAALEHLKDSTGATSREAQVRVADIRASRLGELDQAMTIYESLLAGLTTRDSVAAANLKFKKALVMLQQRRFDEARRVIADIEGNHRTFYLTTPLVQLTKARSFEQERNWERAETEYQYLFENFTNSEEAYNSLLHVADRFRQEGRSTESDRLLARAREIYSQGARLGAGTSLEALALNYQAELYRREENWPKAADILIQLYSRFPNIPAGRNALATAIILLRERLNQPQRADSLRQAYIRSLAPARDESADL